MFAVMGDRNDAMSLGVNPAKPGQHKASVRNGDSADLVEQFLSCSQMDDGLVHQSKRVVEPVEPLYLIVWPVEFFGGNHSHLSRPPNLEARSGPDNFVRYLNDKSGRMGCFQAVTCRVFAAAPSASTCCSPIHPVQTV